MSVLAAIREATAVHHAALEAGFDAVGRLGEPERRRDLLERYLSVYAPAEAALAIALPPHPDFDFDFGARSARLQADLMCHGHTLPTIAMLPLQPPPSLTDHADAIGFAYVLEGATLGGRVIAREAMRRGTSMAGLTFFAHGGAQAGSRFRGFCGVLEQIAGRNPPSAVDGAITGFTFFMNALLDHGSQATHTGSAGAVACG